MTVDLTEFNKFVKPFRCTCKDKRGPSVVYYKKVADYIFLLNQRIINATNLIDNSKEDD